MGFIQEPSWSVARHLLNEIMPEAGVQGHRAIEISCVRYEDEDAHIWVSLPPNFTEEEQEEVANRLAEKSLNILLAEGLLILAGIEEA